MANLFNVDAASFVTGAPVAPGSGWVVMAMDDLAAQEIEHSAILQLSGGQFFAIALKMFRTRYAAWLPTAGEAVFVGDNGECCAIAADGTESDEFVGTGPKNPRNTGHLRSATTTAEEHIIAVGMQRQVYRRVARGTWVDMMQGLPPPAETTGFECVLALSSEEIYAAGWRGEIWRFDGQRWRSVDSPTNRIITAMCLDPSGQVVACGRNGLLITGRHDHWEVIHEGACPDDLWSIGALDQDTLLCAGLRNLYRIDAIGVALADPGGIDAATFGVLVKGAGVLWSIGEKDFLQFDGARWARIK